jgi:hypothetical protein
MTHDSSDSPIIQIPLAPRDRGFFAIVDPIDADLAGLKWSLLYVRKSPYAQRTVGPRKNHKTLYLHRVILGRVLGRELERWELVDHVDRNGLNCKRENLRIATRKQNARNTGKSVKNTSGYKGVTWVSDIKKWIAVISTDNKSQVVGYFTDIKEAARAWNNAALVHHGEFAYQNPIED